MSSAEQIVQEALANDVVLYLKDGRLAYTASGKSFPESLKERIAEHKERVIEYLHKFAGGACTVQGQRAPKILPRTIQAPLPLSFAQQRLWFFVQLEGVGPTYNMPAALRLRGALDALALRRALDALFVRHEALRTVFTIVDGQPQVELLSSKHLFPLVEYDLQGHPDPSASLAKIGRAEAIAPFDLAQGPLIRARLLSLAESDHVLLLTQHHIVSDGWSLGILVNEFSALYGAFVQGKPNPLPPLAVQYPDYALWQRQWLTEDRLAEQLDYWYRSLADAPVLLALPTDRPRSTTPSHAGAVVPIHVDAELTHALKQLSQQHDATLFTIFLAAWAAVLARLSGQDDLVIGTLTANRGLHEIEPLVGFFVNTLALRMDLSGDPDLATLLERTRTTALAAQDHQDVPFEQVVERINPPRSLEHTPVFQVLCAWQSNDRGTFDLPGLKVELAPTAIDRIEFDLKLVLSEVGDTVVGVINYATDLFDATTIERQAGYLLTLLKAMVAQPRRPLAQIDLLAPAERLLLLEDWNTTAAPYPQETCIHELFEEQAGRTPDAVALVLGDRTLSYGELNADANRLAAYLIEQGVRPDDCVAICAVRSFSMVVGLLAILKAGGAYVPLDPDYPAARLAHILDDADPAIVLCDTDGRAALGTSSLRERVVLDIDHPQPAWADSTSGDPDPKALGLTSRHLAYVIYTSGSTGMPKGVQNEHRSLINRLVWMQDAYRLDASDIVLQKTPFGFDVSVWEFFWPLLHGATLVLAPPLAHKDPSVLVELIVKHRITTAHFVPSMLASFLHAAGVEGCIWLKRVICSGEALPASSVQLGQRYLPGTEFHNLYGPTEAAIDVTAWRCPTNFAGEIVPIGRPIANTSIYLLDPHGQPVPLGVVGELHIGGVGVARGYLNRAELTAERFLCDPFRDGPDARMYRTGDLARYLPDGNILYLGRNDHQVKLRGFRIELGEIEARLVEHPDVRDAAVVAMGDDTDKRLVAYVVFRQQAVVERDLDREAHQVDEWQGVYESFYREAPRVALGEDFSVWKSSYTGLSIPLSEMHEWRQAIVERIAALQPRCVLEIGVGSGLLLAQLAASSEAYWATDFSAATIDMLRAQLADNPQLADKVHLRTQAAHVVDDLPKDYFDTIVINSVAQYFPHVAYLIDVIHKAVDLLVPGGSLFLGDIRNLDLLPAFASAVQLRQAGNMVEAASVRRRVEQSVQTEKELLLSPSFFAALPTFMPDIGAVDIQIKRGHTANELSRHRYDVVLRKGPVQTVSLASVAAQSWDRLGGLKELSHSLTQDRPAYCRITQVPNARLAGEVEASLALQTDDDLTTVRRLLDTPSTAGVEPEALYALGESLGYRVGITWSASSPALFDVFFVDARESLVNAVWTATYALPVRSVGELAVYANNPGYFHQLASLRRHVAHSLPDYMVPAVFVTLDALPLTTNGKLDRRALPLPDDAAVARNTYEAPQGDIEVALAVLWQELLVLERVGRRDHFFEIGGHSLLAVRLLSRLAPAFGVRLALADVFAHPTVISLAAVIARNHAVDAGSVAAIIRVSRDGVLPLSFAQQRLWFLSQIDGMSVTYHIPVALGIRGPLNLAALRQSLDALMARHEALRSVFVTDDEGEPQVRLLPKTTPLPLIEHDLRRCDDVSSEFARLGKEEALAPFDLARGPLIRCRLLQLADEDHVLLLTQHHIVSDGWSIGVLSRELGALYQAFQQGQPDPLPALAIQYPDYAAWQRTWLSGDRLEQQIAYWRDALVDAPVLLDLPTDRPRPVRQDFTGARMPFLLDGEVTQALKQLSHCHRTTLFMTMAAAWAVVLSRLSGQDEIVIGTPTANRNRAETEGLTGFFVNILALRIRQSESMSVGDLLSHVRVVSLGAQEHQDLPFEQVVEIVQPPRRMSHTPIFQALLNWDDEPAALSSMSSIEVAPIATSYEVSRYDLKLNLSERNGSLHGTLIYASALFDRATMERHVGYLKTLLRAMVADSTQSVRDIDLLASDERRLLLETWNATATPYPQDRCIHQLFEAQAQKTPDAVAVVDAGHGLSYGDLNAQANRLAHHLISLGVKANDRVAICVERSAAMVVGMLAILKAGAAYVPLDPAYPSERLGQVVADAAPSRVLVDAAGQAALGEAVRGHSVLDLAADAARWAAQSAENPQVPGLDSRHLAYVIYTSGSTGTPKGVMVEHHSVVNFQQAVKRDIYRTESALRIGWNASFSFDMSMKGFLQLLAGHTLVIVPQDVRASSADFLRFLREQAIDAFDVTPTLLKALVAEGLLDQAHPFTVLIGGEAIDPVLWQQLAASRTIAFHNMYGPTECTVDATMSVIGHDDAAPHIGRAIANARIYLLDDRRQPVPLGTPGEIYIGGAGVARGYFNRPELTAERFVHDPFAAKPDARMYRTGDLGRYLPDGRIAYVGRNDQQVKIRGFRIELGEIEARLREHAQVREAVVEAREAGDEKRLVAYVVPTDAALESGPLLSALRQHLGTSLPDYMVPAAFVMLAFLPMTPNGKLDRRALPAPDDEAYARGDYEAPEGEIEQALAALWRELLQIERVGRHDDFFELGGHSLLAVRMMVHIRQSLGAELPMMALFARPTLAGLSQAVIEAGGHVAQTESPIATIPRNAALPLSFAQQRLWFLAQLDGVSDTYHMPVVLRMRGLLDRLALRRSLDALMDRHEALRSVFVTVDSQPQVRLLPVPTAFVLIEHDLRHEHDVALELARLGREEARASFDLTRGPLIRGRLLQSADDEHVLLLTQHHIVSDGWSIGVLSRELSALYQAFQRGETGSLPPLAVQYPDYAAWQRTWLSGERLEQQAAYWRNTMDGAPVLLELPTDRPRPAQQEFCAARLPIVFDAELTRALKHLSQRHGTTLFMTLMAAWAAVLSRLSGQNEVVIGTPTANRSRAETEGLIGFFVNTLALRIDLGGSPTASELLSRVRGASLAAQDHQDLPFEQVVEIVQPPRRLNHTPIFQVMFNWRNNDVVLPDFAGLDVELQTATYELLKFDLELSLSERDEQIIGGLAYATALFDAATVKRQAGYVEALLRAMASDPEQPLAAIDLRSQQERQWLLSCNATNRPYPQDRCIHQLFEERVCHSPHATALVYDGGKSSYAELNAQANRLAHHLRDLGLMPDDRVAICVQRSAVMVVGLLAILKAGGAYVPLDPTYPAERLGQIVADAAPSLVLVDAAGKTALGDAGAGRTLIELDAAVTPWSSKPVENPHVASLTPRHLAYVIYTSGSTGTPKGAMNEHGALINRLLWMQEAYALDSTDVVLQKTSFSFDVSVWEFFWTLSQGAALYLPAPNLHKDPAALVELMISAGVTTAHFVPSMLGMFLATAGVERCTALRRVICSGEALPAVHVQACLARLPRSRLHNLYGPTEAAIDVTAWTCPPSFDGGTVPIGRPIANTQIHLLDDHGHPVPLGAVGELHIGGVGVARGYLHRPDLTAERFVRDPFSTDPTARMYRTGDLARYLPDGNIEYLGRNDFQVKIRGFRIELGEIEALLAQHPQVREAVVDARGAGEDKRLVAYVLPASEALEAPELATVLRAHLATRLPEHMLPAAFVPMPTWPLTPNGKLDRKALPAPGDEAYVRRAYEAPEGEVEQALAALWQELLQIERVGRHDDFFELGGSSLLAVRVRGALQRHLDVQIELSALFKYSVLNDFARHILIVMIEQQFGTSEFENLILSEAQDA